MAVKDMFKGLGAAAVSSRLPDPKAGEADFLLNTMRFKETREHKPFIQMKLTCLRGITEGGNVKGDQVSVPVWSGNRFLKELKGFLIAFIGGTEDEITDKLCPVGCKEAEGLDELGRKEFAFNFAGNLLCALDDDGKELTAGAFDNQRVIRLRTAIKPAEPSGKYLPNPSYDPNVEGSEKMIEETRELSLDVLSKVF